MGTMTALSLVVPVPWPADGTDPTKFPVSYALTPGHGSAEPGPDDWQEASWAGEWPRITGPRPAAPGRYAIWVRRVTDATGQPRIRRAGYLDVTDTN